MGRGSCRRLRSLQNIPDSLNPVQPHGDMVPVTRAARFARATVTGSAGSGGWQIRNRARNELWFGCQNAVSWVYGLRSPSLLLRLCPPLQKRRQFLCWLHDRSSEALGRALSGPQYVNRAPPTFRLASYRVLPGEGRRGAKGELPQDRQGQAHTQTHASRYPRRTEETKSCPVDSNNSAEPKPLYSGTKCILGASISD